MSHCAIQPLGPCRDTILYNMTTLMPDQSYLRHGMSATWRGITRSKSRDGDMRRLVDAISDEWRHGMQRGRAALAAFTGFWRGARHVRGPAKACFVWSGGADRRHSTPEWVSGWGDGALRGLPAQTTNTKPAPTTTSRWLRQGQAREGRRGGKSVEQCTPRSYFWQQRRIHRQP